MKRTVCLILAFAMLSACQKPAEVPQEIIETPPQETITEVPAEEIVVEEVEPLQGIWSDELTALMETINAEHLAVEKPPVSVEVYDNYFPEREALPLPTQPDTELMVDILTQEQAIYDVSYLCYFLSENYALYDFFGGNERFSQALEDMVAEIRTQEQWTPTELMEVIIRHLHFVQDNHFVIKAGSQNASPVIQQNPLFYRNTAFVKTDDGFVTTEGKKVQFVDGQEDLNKLFKRSLSVEGDIVYYPVQFMKCCFNEEYCEYPTALTVHYEDGTKEILITETYDNSYVNRENVNELRIDRLENIKRFTFKNFMNSRLCNIGSELQDEPIVLIDMRYNGGGNADYGWRFWESYTGTKTSGNHLICFARDYGQYLNDHYGVGFESLDGRPIMNTKEDTITEMDNLTIILSSKNDGSAAEDFIDSAHNVENTLIIGENTAGCLTSGAVSQKSLRYSNILFFYAESATIWPEGQFSEGYGLEPDLWCPAADAEEAVMNFIKKNMQ